MQDIQDHFTQPLHVQLLHVEYNTLLSTMLLFVQHLYSKCFSAELAHQTLAQLWWEDS